MHMKGRKKYAKQQNKILEEMREQTAKYILDTGKSATSVAEKMGIDTNTVCRWVRDYRRKHNMPSYAEEKGIHANPPKENKDLKIRVKELEKALKEKEKALVAKDKIITEERERVEILKKSLHIFMQPHE